MTNAEVQVKLVNIKTNTFYIGEPDTQFIESFDDNLLNVGVGVKLSQSEAKNTLTFNLAFSYDYDINGEHPIKLLDFDGSFEYEIANFKDNVTIKGKKLIVDNNLMATLLGISISTARGIIVAKSAGGFINKFYLPIFNPMEIVRTMKSSN